MTPPRPHSQGAVGIGFKAFCSKACAFWPLSCGPPFNRAGLGPSPLRWLLARVWSPEFRYQLRVGTLGWGGERAGTPWVGKLWGRDCDRVSPGDFFFLRVRWLSQFPVLGPIQEEGMRRISQEFFSLGFITPWSFCSVSVMQHFAGGILGESPLSFA